MGIIFGKRKKDTIIRKTNAGSTPKATTTTSVSATNNKNKSSTDDKEEAENKTKSTPSTPSIPSTPSTNGANNPTVNSSTTNQGASSAAVTPSSATKGKSSAVDSIPKEITMKKINNPSPTINFGSENVVVAVSVGNNEVAQQSGPSTVPVIGDAPKKENVRAPTNPLERVVNLYGLSLSLFTITRALLTAQEWDDPLLIQLLTAASNDLDKELSVLKVHERLKDWVHPLHYRKTGSVIGAGKVLASNQKYYQETIEKLKQTGGNGFGYSDQRQLRECLKELLRSYLNFINCCEMVVPADFTAEINELARTMRDVVDTASGKMNYVFDDVARICTTCSVRLARLAIWKSVQATNLAWIRQMSDTCFTITKASKILYQVGLRLYENQNDAASYQNLTALTKGIVTHVKKLQNSIMQEPTEQKQNTYTFTPEHVAEHLATYDQGIKEVQTSLSTYIQSSTDDTLVIEATEMILKQVEAIKATVQSPDTSAIIFAVANISESVEKFCGSIYYALHQVGEENEVIKEQLMETMQHAIYCIIQLQIVACAKGLMFPIVNTEFTLLNSLRSLLLCASIVIEGVDHLKRQKLIVHDPTEQALLTNDEISEAIIYILHYGRPLYKGDDIYEEEEKEEKVENDDDLNFDQVEEKSPAQTLKSKSALSTPSTPSNPPHVSTPTNTPISSPNINKAVTSPNATVSPAKSAPSNEEEDALLEINPDNYNENNLPPGFDPAPPKPSFKQGSSEEEYKKFMLAKYEYETWENKLLLYKIKLKKQIEDIKAKRN